MQLVTVFTSFSPAEAQLVRSRLEAAEFTAFVQHELSALSMDGYSMAAGGILVQVPECEAADACELLKAPEYSQAGGDLLVRSPESEVEAARELLISPEEPAP